MDWKNQGEEVDKREKERSIIQLEKSVLDEEIHSQKPKVKKSSVVRFAISKERAGKSGRLHILVA